MTPDDTNSVYRLGRRPDGVPDRDVFDLTTHPVPDPGPGEALVRVLYFSVDPGMRPRMRDTESYAEPWAVGEPLMARAVGEVVESNGAGLKPGTVVSGRFPWAEYATAPGPELTAVDTDLAPPSAYLGALGATGLTAYFGVQEVAEPQAGETFVVNGAAGAVGSVAGQLAKLDGARVVGFAGSDAKIDYVTDELGFDAVFDHLNLDARVAVCGQIALYNATDTPTGPRKLMRLVEKRARVEGFLVMDHEPRYDQALERLATWVANGDISYRETVTEGIESAPDAFLGLFDGENVGKQLVKVADPEE